MLIATEVVAVCQTAEDKQTIDTPEAPQIETAAQIQRAEQNTKEFLKKLTLAQRYFLLQETRQKDQTDASNITTLPQSFVGQTQFYAPAIKSAAAADGTYEPFGAIFDVMASFGDGGSGSVPAAQNGIQTQLFGRIDWESEHYGYKNVITSVEVGYKKKADFSFGGTLGLYPALVLENLASTTETIAKPNVRPMFQDAFHWTIGPRLNYPLFAHGELTGFAELGQNFLIEQVKSFKEGDNTVTATPVSNSAGRAASFIQGGLEFKLLASPIWVAHDDKISNLSPLFLIASGFRKDTRFSATGDLAGLDHPQRRFFFQFFLTLTKIHKFSDDVQPAAPAALRFGVDLEKPTSEQRVPTATRFFVSANLDILKIFRPTQTP